MRPPNPPQNLHLIYQTKLPLFSPPLPTRLPCPDPPPHNAPLQHRRQRDPPSHPILPQPVEQRERRHPRLTPSHSIVRLPRITHAHRRIQKNTVRR